MKCFYHQTVDAVSLCKSCSRALCPNCIAQVGLSSSCRNRCEADVGTLNDLLERGRTAYQKTGAIWFRSGIFSLLLGGVFMIFGVPGLVSDSRSEWDYFLFGIGLLFAGWSVAQFISSRRISQK